MSEKQTPIFNETEEMRAEMAADAVKNEAKRMEMILKVGTVNKVLPQYFETFFLELDDDSEEELSFEEKKGVATSLVCELFSPIPTERLVEIKDGRMVDYIRENIPDMWKNIKDFGMADNQLYQEGHNVTEAVKDDFAERMEKDYILSFYPSHGPNFSSDNSGRFIYLERK